MRFSALGIRNPKRPVFNVSTITFVLAVTIFGSRVYEGMNTVEYSDEWEQFVVAQMIVHGSQLYRNIFSHHGPIPYIIAHLYSVVVSESDFSLIRLSVALVAVGAGAALAFTPVLRKFESRLWACAIYLLLLSAVWSVESINILHYMTISGPLFVVMISQLVVPAIMGCQATRWGMFVSGLAAVIACFSAYSLGPAVLMLVLSTVAALRAAPNNMKLYYDWKMFLMGAALAGILVLAWLWCFGDFLGFFVYHFYFNQEAYAEYTGVTIRSTLRHLSISINPNEVVHTLLLAMFVGWLCMIIAFRKPLVRPWRNVALTLLVLAVALTDPIGTRRSVWQYGFTSANFSLFSICCGLLLDRCTTGGARLRAYATAAPIGAVIVAAYVGAYAVSHFGVRQKELDKYHSTMKVEQNATYDFIRSITRKENDFLALNYNALLYIKLGRLPASGNLFYFPWQAYYNRSPVLGYKFDLCSDIRKNRPAVIWLYNWNVVNRYGDLSAYEPCVLPLVAEGYRPLHFASPWHVRKDLWDIVKDKAPKEARLQLEPVYSLFLKNGETMRLRGRSGSADAIDIVMTAEHRNRRAELKRISVLLRTYGDQKQAVGELRLYTSTGSMVKYEFSFSEHSSDTYRHFDVEPGRYTGGSVAANGQAVVNAWEGKVGEQYNTCAIYVYTNDEMAFTPSCPIM